MTSQHRGPRATCAQHVGRVGVCVAAVWLFATPAFSDAIGYNSWQWHGVSYSSSSSSSSSAASTAATFASTYDSSTSTASSTSSESSGGSYGYSSWQWRGISSSVQQDVTSASQSYSTSVTPFVGNGGTASLSGYVYLDTSDSHVMDSADWAIANAKLSVTEADSSTLVGYAYTKQDGSYSFGDLAKGTYTISLLTPCSEPGLDNGLSQMITSVSGDVSAGTGTAVQNAYDDVTLNAGDTGTNFNFAELIYPSDLISKAMFLMNSPAILHTTDVVTPTVVPRARLSGVARHYRAGSRRPALAPFSQGQSLIERGTLLCCAWPAPTSHHKDHKRPSRTGRLRVRCWAKRLFLDAFRTGVPSPRLRPAPERRRLSGELRERQRRWWGWGWDSRGYFAGSTYRSI